MRNGLIVAGWVLILDEAEAVHAAATVTGEVPRTITVAMTPGDAAELMAQLDTEPSPWFDLLRQRVALGEEPDVLGFEVVGAEEGLDFHSWHCHGYADDVWRGLGIHTNDKGLIPTYADAQAVLSWMRNRPDDDAPEPVPWTIVALAGAEAA